MKKKVMISQPMSGFTDEQIRETRDKAIKWINDNDYELINSYFPDYVNDNDETVKHKPVDYLSRAIYVLSKSDILLMCPGWEDARGCKAEKYVADAYDIEVVYLE